MSLYSNDYVVHVLVHFDIFLNDLNSLNLLTLDSRRLPESLDMRQFFKYLLLLDSTVALKPLQLSFLTLHPLVELFLGYIKKLSFQGFNL